MSCTDQGPFEGGTYTEPTILNPKVNGGEFNQPSVTGEVKVDNTAAYTLLAALQEVEAAAVTNEPKKSEGTDVPTIIVGEDRTVILGKPFKWIKLGSVMIPAFRAE